MRKINCSVFIIFLLLCSVKLHAQDIHFSQFYNTPMLQNAANTALMSDRDYRVSSIYRDQWSSIPAPFKTFSVAGEFQTFRNNAFTNWLGIGVYGISDRAGDGDLSLTSYGLNVAYHLMLGESSALSVGLGASYVSRGIDFSKLTFDAQWDGFTFNKSLPNGEIRPYSQSKYVDVVAGVNYSFFPNENMFFKFGAGMSHINRPNVSLLGLTDNRLDFRPMLSGDAIILFENNWKVSPAMYFTFMQNATNTILGTSVGKGFSSQETGVSGYVYAGAYYRLNESIIAQIGIEWSDVKLTASYDITVSPLAAANKGSGAFEVSLIFQGLYGGRSGFNAKTPWECPRF